MKKILLIFTFILLLVAVPVTVFLVKQQQDIRQKAAPATTLYFSPENSIKQIGDEFTLDVMIDTGENNVSAAELHFNYNSTYLEMKSLTVGDFLTTVMESPVISNGTASISVFKGASTEIKTGTGILVHITLKALTNTTTPTQISITDNSIVTGIKEDSPNVILGKTPAIITIGTTAQPSPSATPATTPNPSATPNSTPNVSPSTTPSTSPQLTTTITSPANNTTTTNTRPQITGTSFNNALLNININTNPVLTSTFNASATGTWTYAPTSDIPSGTYAIVLTAQNPVNQALETITSSFTVTISGGTAVATPTPNPTPAATTTTTTTTVATPKASTTTTSTVPVTGTTLPTALIISLSIIFLILGIAPVFFLK